MSDDGGQANDWRGILDALPDPVYVQDREGRFVEVNAAAASLLGYSRDELIGQTPTMLAVPGRVGLDEVLERIAAALAGERQVFAWWTRDKAGEERPKQITLERARFGGEDVVVATARDMRTAVEREVVLGATRARYEAVFELASDGLLIASASGEVELANRRAAALFGRTRDELVGARLAELLAPMSLASSASTREKAEGRHAELEAALAERDSISTLSRWVLRGAAGEPRWVDLGFSPLPPSAEGSEASILVSLHDYTERKRSTDALQSVEERERVSERLRALGELAAGVAHNFNNALTSILAHTQVLVRSEELPDWARDDLRVIERVSRGAAVTVRRIQGFARTRDPDAFENADLADIVANAIALTRPRWKPPGDERFTLDWTPSEARLPVVANAAELCEVVVNLITNALDAMPEGGTLAVATGLDGDRVFVEVSDTGVGIDASAQRRLFDPFFSTKGRQGMGLGLSVSHGIIERHGGEISVESGPEQGSRFSVWLPLGQHSPEQGSAPLVGARPSTILLVDDDPVVRQSLVQMLEQLGHEVVSAEHGRDALARLDERSDIELLLTDLAMPVLDGAGLLREVSRRFPDLPRVLMTGLVADIESDLVEVANLVLSKPLDLAVIDRVLARFLPRPPGT